MSTASAEAAKAAAELYYNNFIEEYAIYFTVPVAILVILITTFVYGFRVNILDYILYFFQDLYSIIFIFKSNNNKKKKTGDINLRKALPIANLRFDYLTSKLLISGIGKEPLSVDIVCKYELPAPTWYSRNQQYDCRLSTSKNVIQMQQNKGCVFSDANVKITIEFARIFCSKTSNGLHIFPTLTTLTDRTVRLIGISFEVDLKPSMPYRLSKSKMFINGFQSWSPTGSVSCASRMSYTLLGLPIVSRPVAGMIRNVDSEYWGRGDGLTSQHMTAFQSTDSKDSILWGFTKQTTAIGEFFFHRNTKKLTCTLDYEKTLFSTDIGMKGLVEVKVEPLLVMFGAIDFLLETWATECAPTNYHRKLSDVKTSVGWCSWYKFYDKVSQVDITRNANFIADEEKMKDIDCRVVQLDDGFQSHIGDWLTVNRKFPDGLPGVARQIKKKGMAAGIWLAPFLAGHGSVLFRDRPEWFVKDQLTGSPLIAHLNPDWGSDFICYSLDTTNPQVQSWLKHIFSTLVAYGFTYFKIDFLVAGIRRGNRYDRYSSRAEAYRKGLDIIRKAIGPDCYLVGCGAPLGPSIGYFDAMRVSSDTNAEWDEMFLQRILGAGDGPPCLRNALHFSITRSFLHRKWWLNDPDCVLLPGTGLTNEEMILQLTVICMSSGVVVISEDMPSLDLDKISLLKRILPTSQLVSGQPRNVLLHRFPTLYVCSGCDPSQRSSLFAFINWKNYDVTIDTKIDLEDELQYLSSNSNEKNVNNKEVVHESNNKQDDVFSNFFFFDFWQERPLRDDLILLMKPHSSRALLATRFDDGQDPKLIGNSFHLIAMVDGRISGQMDLKNNYFIVNVRDVACEVGKLWVAMPTNVVTDLNTENNIKSNAIVNVTSTTDLKSHKNWSVMEFSVDATKIDGDDGQWYIKIQF